MRPTGSLTCQVWPERFAATMFVECVGSIVSRRSGFVDNCAITRKGDMVSVENQLWTLWRAASRFRFRTWRKVSPISASFGFDRGLPIDRYFIEAFLAEHAADVRGRVLEVGDNAYTRKYGGQQVVRSDVLHAISGTPDATIIGDLSVAEGLPTNAFDCILLTQTLNVVYDVRAAARNVYCMLKPGGVLLATVPGISQISRWDRDRWGDYWRFTTMSAQRLFTEVGAMDVHVKAFGNVLSSTAFLHGLAADELRKSELDHLDPDYELLIAIRVVKSEDPRDGTVSNTSSRVLALHDE